MTKRIQLTSRARKAIFLALVCAAAVPATDAAYMLAKAELAQFLITRAWTKSTTHTSPQNNTVATINHYKPWPWADMHPVARLQIDRLNMDTWVLNGASGTTLAFGPGLAEGSSDIGDNGLTMIGAHRDTHFKDLKHIVKGDNIKLQSTDRQWHTYRVTHIGIADTRVDALPVNNDQPYLALITCYPFNTLTAGGPLRFVVEATLIQST